MIDFAHQIAIQEGWSSFGFSVLVAGLAGEIVLLALPANSAWHSKATTAFFTVVIIVGCALEHVADSKISDLISLEEAQTARIVATANAKTNQWAKAVYEQLKWREFTRNDIDRFAERFRGTTKSLDVFMLIDDEEASSYASAMIFALRKAGLTVRVHQGAFPPDAQVQPSRLLNK